MRVGVCIHRGSADSDPAKAWCLGGDGGWPARSGILAHDVEVSGARDVSEETAHEVLESRIGRGCVGGIEVEAARQPEDKEYGRGLHNWAATIHEGGDRLSANCVHEDENAT